MPTSVHSLCLIFSSCFFYSASIQCAPQKDYQGVLTTLRNHNYPIFLITIAGKKTCIPVFTAPDKTDTLLTRLNYNPKEQKKYIKLADIKEIEIPYPYATWHYKDSCGKQKYLLIKITWNIKNKKSMHFLIEPKRRLGGILEKKSGKAKTHIPFSGFKKCTVKATTT